MCSGRRDRVANAVCIVQTAEKKHAIHWVLQLARGPLQLYVNLPLRTATETKERTDVRTIRSPHNVSLIGLLLFAEHLFRRTYAEDKINSAARDKLPIDALRASAHRSAQISNSELYYWNSEFTRKDVFFVLYSNLQCYNTDLRVILVSYSYL